MKRMLASLTLVLTVCTQLLAESSVWKVRGGESVLYLGGTCHLLRSSDFPLPREFDEAYRASDMVVFETDLDEITSPAAQRKLMSEARYTDGSTIEQHLSPQTYALLKAYCKANGIPLDAIKHLKPSMAAAMVTTIELSKLGVTEQGVDMVYHRLAKKDEKPVEALESVDLQIKFMAEMGKGIEDAFVTYSIEDLKSLKQQYEALVEAWRKGDAGKLTELMVADLKARTPNLYRELLVDRNQSWLPRIDAYQKTPQTEFILVGVGHLVGPDGIVEALRRKGYTVDKL